jgi:hypothetical protein
MDEYSQEPEWSLGKINLNQVFSARALGDEMLIEGGDKWLLAPEEAKLARARIRELNTWRPRPSDKYGEGLCDERRETGDILGRLYVENGVAYG